MSQSTRLELTDSHGATLIARLVFPAGAPRGYALLAHRADLTAGSRIAQAVTEQGIAVLCLDFGDADPGSRVDDLEHAADQLRTTYAAPSILIGHALDGAATVAASHRIPEVRAVATIAAPAQAPGLRIEDGQPTGTALLVMHSPADEVIYVDSARRLLDAAQDPKSFIAMDGADHLLSEPADARYAAAMLAAWASRYVPTTTRATTPPEGTVVVTENGAVPYGQRITVGPHVLSADEPEPTGLDGGPNPYDLLLAALGACTSMTIRMYAQRKQWPLREVSVALRHSRIHATDCADCETRAGLVDHIDRVVTLRGDLDDEQRKRLMTIADKCPVHRTLRSEVDVTTTEATG